MSHPTAAIDTNVSMPELTRVLLDIYSVSGEEKTLADAIYRALETHPHLHLVRDGDAIIARTDFRAAERAATHPHPACRASGHRAAAYRGGVARYGAFPRG